MIFVELIDFLVMTDMVPNRLELPILPLIQLLIRDKRFSNRELISCKRFPSCSLGVKPSPGTTATANGLYSTKSEIS